MVQLGISAFYHDSAACLVIDGKVVSAAEEERFTGIKHDDSFPINAINWILSSNRISIEGIDQVCWYETPDLKKKRVLKSFNKNFFSTLSLRYKFLVKFKKQDPTRKLKELGYTGEIVQTYHHSSHAAFSYFTSTYNDAAVLTIDGVGESETVTITKAEGTKLESKFSLEYPNSLGMLYSTITAYLGFKPNEGEYKVMGLAPYGNPDQFFSKLHSLFTHKDGKFILNIKGFDWEKSDRTMFNSKLCSTLGILPRLPQEEVTQEHKNLASALQKVYEVEFLKLVKIASEISESKNLCLSGGCAYNGVANTLAYKYFDSIHIPFAPSDAGSSIGACLYHYKGKKQLNINPFLGPEFKATEIHKSILEFPDRIVSFKLSDELLVKKVGEILNNQMIVAWFRGGMEFGARALGNRSILASPSNPKMREKLNYVIKKREGFRPFAPSVIADKANKYFDIVEDIPYMNQVVQAKTKKLPAATHIDNSCRVHTVTPEQNPIYYRLLSEVGRLSGIPVLLNTSFNLKDQTITITPRQAIERFLDSEIDFLVLNNYLVQKL